MDSKIIVNPTFDTAGSRELPALLLIHGSVVTRKMWLSQMQGLSHVYHVIAPDLPGHGTLSHIPFTFASAEQRIAKIIEDEAKGRALVAGLSLGGYVAIKLAENHPNLIAGLVLSGCSPSFRGGLGLYLKFISRLMQIGLLKQSRQKAEQKVRQMFPPELADAAETQVQDGVFPEALGSSFAEMAGEDFAASLAKFRGPCLILNGEHDITSRKGEQQFASVMVKSQIQTIPNAGHACCLDQSEVFNKAIRDFGRSIGLITG